MKRILFACVLAMGLAAYAHAQVSGTVTDAAGEPVIGANVVIKGTTSGVVTNFEGKYTIADTEASTVLVFSFVGMVSQEIPVGAQSTINVVLQENALSLAEAVVVGYGTVSKKLLSGSVTSVDSEQLENSITSGIDGAIQGKMAGVQVVQNSGTPGSAISVLVRGNSSITGSSQPLYVIDGVPMTTGDFSQIGYEGQGINALSDLNPGDIESITVLKDASQAAIYGARASNGVVLITTKTGSLNKTRINLGAYSGMQSTWRRLDMLNASEFMTYINEANAANGQPAQFTDAEIANPAVDTDWQNEIFRTAPVSQYDLSASGGDERTRFYVSGTWFDQQGIIIGTGYRRLSGRLNLDHEVNSRFRIMGKVGISYGLHNRVPGDQTINGVLPNAISKPPINAVTDENGNYLEEGFWDNPVAIANEALNEAASLRNIINMAAEYDLLENLTLKHQWGVDFYNLVERRYEPTTTDRGAENNGIGIYSGTDSYTILQQTTLNYEAEVGSKGDLTLLGGWSFEKASDINVFIRGNNFPSDDLKFLVSAGNIETATTNGFESGLNSFFGRLNYVHDKKYILTLNSRVDGSSAFGQNNRYAFLPGAALAWRITEEAFMPESSVLNELKLRLSYGLTGNDAIGSFRALNLYSSGFNYNGNPGIVPTQIPNPDLKWETTRNLNLGLDAELWDSRVSATLDVYDNYTTDLLLNRPLPGSAGFTFVSANVGTLQNRGIELGINTDNLRDAALSWQTNFNLSLNRNKVLALYNDQPLTNQGRGDNAVLVGQPIGVFYQYESQGVDPSTGELVLRDVNFDGQITDADRVVTGDPNPDFTGGMTNTFNWRGLDLSVFLQWSYGNDIYNGVRQYAENMTFGDNDNQLATVALRWQQEGDRAPVPRTNGLYNNWITSHYLEDGSFLRVKNVTLGYTLPKAMTDKMKLRNARVYFNGQNLLTFTNYTGLDPEVNYSGISTVSMGTDFFTFPQARVATVGVNIGI